MGNVYTVEMGCIYEGGYVILATDNLLSALKCVKDQRTKNLNQFFEDRDIISSAVMGRHITPDDWCYLRESKWYWLNGSDYIKIKEWNDGIQFKK